MAAVGTIQVRVELHALGFVACAEGNLRGECVLADGHEKRESEHRTAGGEPVPVQWDHIDRYGTHWGVQAATLSTQSL